MSVWAMVPIKPLNRAKSRLAPILSPEQREKLALGMLMHNLTTLTQTPMVAGVLVISRDMKALAAAREVEGVQTLQESGTPELNTALRRASKMLNVWGAGATLILPADIPLVQPTDIQALIHLGRYSNCIVIAPDRLRDGTNAIFSRPPDLIDYDFGVGSFQKHIQNAEFLGVDIHIYESEFIALDLDTPDDLAHYKAMVEKHHLEGIDYHSLEEGINADG